MKSPKDNKLDRLDDLDIQDDDYDVNADDDADCYCDD
jgi:hypothetical protein